MSSSEYRVRTYQEGDEERILELFRLVFGADHPGSAARTLPAWSWEYRDNPAGRQIALAEDARGKTIAHYACLPAQVHVQGVVGIAGQGVDSMVHPDYRRGLKKEGPFLAAARLFFETWGNARVSLFGFGFPNQKALRLGVRVLHYVPVLEQISTLYRNFYESQDDDRVGRAFEGEAEVVEVERFGPEVDALWERLRPSYPFAVVRDSRYLNWRYADAVHLAYRLFEVRSGGRLRGHFVTRAHWQGLPILALADLFCEPADEAVVALALRQAVQAARAAGMVRVELWLPPGYPQFQAALRHGFRTERCQYTLCVMLYHERPPLDWVRDHWYFTIGDSDVF